MDRSGALKLTAIFIVSVLGISTVGFGLLLASNSTNATAAASSQGNHNGSSDSNRTQCLSLSSTAARLSAEFIVLDSSVNDQSIVKG